MSEDLLIPWTIRLSLLLYATALGLLVGNAEHAARGLAKWLWGLGAMLLVAHVLAAFHWEHRWSHAAAYAETAQGTRQVIGIDWGGGLYVNYLFALVWLGDALWWFVSPRSHRSRPRWLHATTHAFLAFVVVNATIVFHEGPIRWSAVAGLLLLGAVAAQRTPPAATAPDDAA